MKDVRDKIKAGATIQTDRGAWYIADSDPYDTPAPFAIIDMRNGTIVKWAHTHETYAEICEDLHIRRIYSISEIEEASI